MPSTNGINFYYPNSNTHVLYAYGTDLFPNSSEGRFAKRDTKFYITSHNSGVGVPNKRILEFNAATGVQLNEWDSIADFDIVMMAATAGFLYCLGTTQGDPDGQAIKKIDRTTGLVTATFMLDNIGPTFIGVVNDNLIYVFCNGVQASLYYVKNFTSLILVGRTVGLGITPFGNGAGMFVGGAFYFGSNGFAGFGPDIFKITVACPETTPIIASITRALSTVVAGNPITVNWANVFEPHATDEIQLRPEPAAGDLGFSGPPDDFQLADGLGTSSLAYTIPALTTPGDYVFMYVSHGDTLVATSAAFEVT